jgi:hypothetical protein
MRYPKVHSVKALDSHRLLVEFNNHEKRIYDVKPLLTLDRFMPLKNLSFFKNVTVDAGGYGIVWNNEIDISEYELWIKELFLTNPIKKPVLHSSDNVTITERFYSFSPLAVFFLSRIGLVKNKSRNLLITVSIGRSLNIKLRASVLMA